MGGHFQHLFDAGEFCDAGARRIGAPLLEAPQPRRPGVWKHLGTPPGCRLRPVCLRSDLAGAEREMLQLQRERPHSAHVYIRLAMVYLAAQRLDEAGSLLPPAQAADALLPPLAFIGALLRLFRREFDAAVEWAENHLDLHPAPTSGALITPKRSNWPDAAQRRGSSMKSPWTDPMSPLRASTTPIPGWNRRAGQGAPHSGGVAAQDARRSTWILTTSLCCWTHSAAATRHFKTGSCRRRKFLTHCFLASGSQSR